MVGGVFTVYISTQEVINVTVDSLALNIVNKCDLMLPVLLTHAYKNSSS